MRVVLQRVSRGQVSVAGEVVGQVGAGYVALVGITHSDTPAIVAAIAQKTAHLRVFDDDDGKMNRSILEVGGGVLVISQFTLYADARKGRRPSYTDAARPEHAEPLVNAYVEQLQTCGIAHVQTGRFGAMMHVEIHNDGPVTIILDSSEMLGS